jgi:hypothetical protein
MPPGHRTTHKQAPRNSTWAHLQSGGTSSTTSRGLGKQNCTCSHSAWHRNRRPWPNQQQKVGMA